MKNCNLETRERPSTITRRHLDIKILHQPLCVVNVKNKEEIKKVLTYCNENKIHVIARTGASSSEDQLLVIDDQTIIVDASAMNRLIKLDTENMMATVECGMPLAQLEKLANEKGLTTGHSPQSSPLAHLGGLVATRSIGQFSTYYGGIEDMLAAWRQSAKRRDC